MAIRIFVTATNTDVGKTYTTLGLMEEAARQGFRPGAFKPIETGVENQKPSDGTLLLETMKRLNPQMKDIDTKSVVPSQFTLPAAPYVAKGEESIDWENIDSNMREIEKRCDILFIEGAGGLMVPIEKDCFMIDLPRRFDAHTLLLSPSRLGSINDTLLSMEALLMRKIPFDLAINLFEESDSFAETTLPFYEKSGIPFSLLPKDSSALLEKLVSS
ncbi:dethiobiotin synthase [Hydrogenimonas sp.]